MTTNPAMTMNTSEAAAGAIGRRRLGGRAVNPVGFGCMNFCWAYGTPPEDADVVRLLHAVLDAGYDHLDTARLYGGGRSEAMIGATLAGRRDAYYLASKMGIFADGQRRYIDCSPATIRREVEISLQALRTDHIDLYYMHRRDFSVPIEDSAAAMAALIAEGKIGGYGLSEVSAETVRRAHAVHPVTAVQNEYSLWSRNSELGVLAATAELGVAFVAFSPLARGALAGGVDAAVTLDAGDIRRTMPRFQPEHWPANHALIQAFDAVAAAQGVTPAQLSLAWVLSRGAHVHVIPGTRTIAHAQENIARWDWQPGADVLARLDALINQHVVAGPRYNPGMQAMIDTEEFG